MNILWISHLLPYPPKGGVMQRSYNLIKEVARENNVYLFALNQKAWLSTEEDVENAVQEFWKICKKVEVFRIKTDKSIVAWYKLAVTSLFSKKPYTVNWTLSEVMKHRIDEFLELIDVDIIHCDTIGLAEYIKEKKEIPKVLNHHNIESQMMLRRAKKENNLLKKLYFYIEGIKIKKYESKMCLLFNMNIVVSDLDKERLQSILPGLNTEVISNGVNVDYFQPNEYNPISQNIVFSASMDWYPNEDAVIYFVKDVWPLVKIKYPGSIFTIVGRNPSNRIKTLTKNDSSIILTGYVDDVRPFIDRAGVYVCPIRDGGGTKLKLLDAMAMEKAIVTTSLGAEGLEVEDGKHVLIADNPTLFASQIFRIFETPGLNEYLKKNARRLVEDKYSWKIIGDKLNNIYISMG